ncbi:MAG: preprotein translocase subunit SecA, partial [Candidatus Cloacimonetes bacterium]|nr:preprotein translocase subunit SecA [Candidatus Cloacimonadota bacterium]
MLEKILRSLFGDKSTKEISKYQPIVEDINDIYKDLADYEDEQLKERIQQIKAEISEKLQPLRTELAETEQRYREEPEESERSRLDNDIERIKKELKSFTKDTLDDFLPEVFAIVKDTCRRLLGYKYEIRGHEAEWNMVPFDVQLIGGMALHDGKI